MGRFILKETTSTKARKNKAAEQHHSLAYASIIRKIVGIVILSLLLISSNVSICMAETYEDLDAYNASI